MLSRSIESLPIDVYLDILPWWNFEEVEVFDPRL